MRGNNWKNKGKKLLATVMLACLLLAVTGESSSVVTLCGEAFFEMSDL